MDSLSERLAGNDQNKILFRPRRRLRHLRGIEAVGLDVNEGRNLYYTLWRREGDPEMATLLLKSEEVPVTAHVEWDDIDFGSTELPSTEVHGSASGIFDIRIHSACDELNESLVVMSLSVDLNQVVQAPKREALQGVYFRLEKGLYCVPVTDSAEDMTPFELRTSVEPLSPKNQKEAPAEDAVKLVTPVDVQSEDSGSSHLAVASNASTDGRDTWTHGPHGYKIYNIIERRGDIRRLKTDRDKLEKLVEQRKQLHLHLSDVLRRKRARIEHVKKLRKLKQRSEECAVQKAHQTRRLEDLQSESKTLQLQRRQNMDRLTSSSQDLKGAAGRWQEAQDSLIQQFMAKNQSLHKSLVARRCSLVSSMASIFGLRPYQTSLAESDFPEIEEIIDLPRWASKSGKKSSAERERDRTYLGIVGLDLSPSLSRMMENGFVECSLSYAQCDVIEAALSYVANVVVLSSHYLDVPLRYPIKLLGSRSQIFLSPRRAVRTTEAAVGSEHPLYFQGTGRFSKKRLGNAFALLAKNIHQLLASHGLKSTSRSSVLQNLDILVAASRSGLCTHHRTTW